MPLYDVQKLLNLEATLKIRPTVITYSRLEPVNLTSGDLPPGLEMPIADPLWMIGRQWQFEELRGEDGGSPILAEVGAERAPTTRFHAGSPVGAADPSARAVDVPGPALPVEVAVEAETPTVLPERVRAELGLQLLRLTRAAGLPKPVLAKVEAALVGEWPFKAAIDPDVDPGGAARRRLLAGRIPDGALAAKDVAARRGQGGTVQSLPDSLRQAVGNNGPRRATLRKVLADWLSF